MDNTTIDELAEKLNTYYEALISIGVITIVVSNKGAFLLSISPNIAESNEALIAAEKALNDALNEIKNLQHK